MPWLAYIFHGYIFLRCPAQASCPPVVAMVSGKQTDSQDNADSGVQFITPAGPRQSLLLAKDPDQFFVKTLYTLSVGAQTHLPKFPETSLNKGKERYNQS